MAPAFPYILKVIAASAYVHLFATKVQTILCPVRAQKDLFFNFAPNEQGGINKICI